MQAVSTVPSIFPGSSAAPSRQPERASEEAYSTPGERRGSRERDKQGEQDAASPENRAGNYRLNFDSEKRRVYLEQLNPVTGNVIQRLPRDDIEFASVPRSRAPGKGVDLSV